MPECSIETLKRDRAHTDPGRPLSEAGNAERGGRSLRGCEESIVAARTDTGYWNHSGIDVRGWYGIAPGGGWCV